MAKFKRGDLVEYANEHYPSLSGVAVIVAVSRPNYLGDDPHYTVKWIVGSPELEHESANGWNEEVLRPFRRGGSDG